MDINACLRPPSSLKVISGISCLQGGLGGGRVLDEFVLQELGLPRTGLTLARFEGYHVVECSHFHSFNSSHPNISRGWHMGLEGVCFRGDL